MLELRPWHVRTEKSTWGHALVVMLAYLVTHRLQQAWKDFDLTVEEGLHQLSGLCSIKMTIKDGSSCHRIPAPNQTVSKLLEAANIRLPKVLPSLGANVVSRKSCNQAAKTPDLLVFWLYGLSAQVRNFRSNPVSPISPEHKRDQKWALFFINFLSLGSTILDFVKLHPPLSIPETLTTLNEKSGGFQWKM